MTRIREEEDYTLCYIWTLLLLQAVRALEAELQQFMSTYIILSDYLDDAAAKICDMWSRATSVVIYWVNL